MIPRDINDWIFPKIAVGSANAVVLRHVCGVDIEFFVSLRDGEEYTVSNEHLSLWDTSIETIAQTAGYNCFSYNTLPSEPDGVYYNDDGNTFTILLSPGTFIEHNGVDGQPLLLVISESDCIFTGTKSVAGNELIKQYLPQSIASRVVTIESPWDNWIVDDGSK